jgi:protocatechuate 3,4-dioxygenase beta subunit
MTRLLVLAVIAACAAVEAAPARQQTVQHPGETAPRRPAEGTEQNANTAGLRGHVTGVDGRPIRSAEVKATGVAGNAATTDEAGRYEIDALPAGDYVVTASKSGYATVELGQARPGSPGRRLHLADGESADRVDLVLPRAGAISGRVVDENGDGIQGADVSLLAVRFDEGRRHLAGVLSRMTDDRGRFRLFAVQPGQYVLTAAAATRGPYRLPGYAPAFYPGSPHAAEAEILTVGPAEDLAEVEIRLAPGHVATVSGAAFNSRGEPYHGRLLLAASQRSGALAGPQTAGVVRPDGTFEFVNVAPGDYVLQAIERGFPGGEFAMQYVAVGDADIGGITIRTAPGSAVRGHIIVDSDSHAEPRDFSFMFRQADFDLAPMQGTYRAKINDDWTFDMVNLFGPLFIRPTGSPEWLLKSVRVDGTDITDVPVSFGRKDDSLSDVEVVLTKRGAEISGTAIGAQGQPAADYTAVVFAADSARWFPQSRFMKTARSGSDGTFGVRGLPGGDYYVAAIDHLPGTESSGEWQDPRFLESLARGAVRVTLTEGQKTAVSLRLP